MSKVYQAKYSYTETYCHPNPEEWETATKILCTTLDESLAHEIAEEHNRGLEWWSSNRATVVEFELTSR